MNNRNSQSHTNCCNRQQVFPRTVEETGEAHHVTSNDVFISQFGSTSSTRRVIELAVEDILGHWAGDHLPYDGRGPANADVAASRWWWGHEPVTCRMVELRAWSLHETPRMEWRPLKWNAWDGFLGGGMCATSRCRRTEHSGRTRRRPWSLVW